MVSVPPASEYPRRVREVPSPVDPGLWIHPEWAGAYPWLVQGTTGRPGPAGRGGRDFALPPAQHPGEAGEAPGPWERLSGALGFPRIVLARQVHQASVRVHASGSLPAPASGPGLESAQGSPRISPDGSARPRPGRLLLADDCDGHATRLEGVLLAVTVADCVPVFLVDPRRKAVSLLHAGWRGAAAGILEAGVRAMKGAFGTDPADVQLHLGPSICRRCYEVGPEVFRAFGLPEPEAPMPLDLRGLLAGRGLGAGIREERVTSSDLCTLCDQEAFYSHRGGDKERQVGVLGVRNGAGRRGGEAEGDPGLCGACRWARVLENKRGSTFFLCRKSSEDPSFPKYPRLPVHHCPGFLHSGSSNTVST